MSALYSLCNTRLSCPHLVRAIDELEASGGINSVNKDIADESSPRSLTLRDSFREANVVWREVRELTMDDRDRAAAAKIMGEDGYNSMMKSGIIGYFNSWIVIL